jgi:hypothetical protein
VRQTASVSAAIEFAWSIGRGPFVVHRPRAQQLRPAVEQRGVMLALADSRAALDEACAHRTAAVVLRPTNTPIVDGSMPDPI